MEKGEIFLVELPEADGHEQMGQRPALFLSKPMSKIAIIVPMTSNMEALRFPHTHIVHATEENGLNGDTVALVFQLRAIDVKRLGHKIGAVSSDVMREIDENLTEMLILE